MRVNYKVNDRCTLDIESKDMKQTFDILAYADSIFGIKKCGNPDCGSTNLKFETRRTKEGYIFRSIVCKDCGYTLKISEQKPENGGKMYPDREWMEPYNGGEKRDASSNGRAEDTAPFEDGKNGAEDEGYDEKPKSRRRAKAAVAAVGDDIDF